MAKSRHVAQATTAKPDIKSNAFAHVSFFAAIGIVLFYLFLTLPRPVVGIPAIALPVLSIITGSIALSQIKRRQ